MKVLIINGPNLNKLGKRDKGFYGVQTLDEINKALAQEGNLLGLSVTFFQSNIEGELVGAIQDFEGDAIIINAGAYTHYSIALGDALKDSTCIKVEVHLSNIMAREEFRHVSMLSSNCDGIISGFGADSYSLALVYVAKKLQGSKGNV